MNVNTNTKIINDTTKITFFLTFAHSFKHQILDQQHRNPTKTVQILGGDQAKQSADLGP